MGSTTWKLQREGERVALRHHLRAGSIMTWESQRQGLEAAGHTIAGVGKKKETHAGALLGFSSVIWFKTPNSMLRGGSSSQSSLSANSLTDSPRVYLHSDPELRQAENLG